MKNSTTDQCIYICIHLGGVSDTVHVVCMSVRLGTVGVPRCECTDSRCCSVGLNTDVDRRLINQCR